MYSLIVDNPELAGADQETVACWKPALAVTFVGGEGSPAVVGNVNEGPTLTDDSLRFGAEFLATPVSVYVAPGVSPCRTQDVRAVVHDTAEPETGVAVTV